MPAESAVKDGLATDRQMGYIFSNSSVRHHNGSMVAHAGSGVAIGDFAQEDSLFPPFSNPRQNPTAASFLISSICQPFLLRRTGGVTKDVCDDGMHIYHTSRTHHYAQRCTYEIYAVVAHGFDALILFCHQSSHCFEDWPRRRRRRLQHYLKPHS